MTFLSGWWAIIHTSIPKHIGSSRVAMTSFGTLVNRVCGSPPTRYLLNRAPQLRAGLLEELDEPGFADDLGVLGG